jgi:hypothetical protein
MGDVDDLSAACGAILMERSDPAGRRIPGVVVRT